MDPLIQQVVEAYRREETLYAHILATVEEQCDIMAKRPDPATVLQLCRQVEEVMVEITGIERDLEPAKERWEEIKNQLPKELDSSLASIQDAIEKITRGQAQVLDSLKDYVLKEQQTAESARATVNAHRAREAYGTQ